MPALRKKCGPPEHRILDTINLRTTNSDLVELAVGWVLTGTLPAFNKNNKEDWIVDFIDLWMLSDSWGMAPFCDLIIKKAQKTVSKSKKWPMVHPDDLPRFFDKLPKDSPLTNFMVDIWLLYSYGKPAFFDPMEEYERKPFFGLYLAKRSGALEGRVSRPFDAFDNARYHCVVTSFQAQAPVPQRQDQPGRVIFVSDDEDDEDDDDDDENGLFVRGQGTANDPRVLG